MRSQLVAQFMPFFRLIAHILTFCDKKYRILTFRDKSTVFQRFATKQSLARSGSLLLSEYVYKALAWLTRPLLGPCSARSSATALQHFLQPCVISLFKNDIAVGGGEEGGVRGDQGQGELPQEGELRP